MLNQINNYSEAESIDVAVGQDEIKNILRQTARNFLWRVKCLYLTNHELSICSKIKGAHILIGAVHFAHHTLRRNA